MASLTFFLPYTGGEIENPDFSLGCFSPRLYPCGFLCYLPLSQTASNCRKRFRITLKRTRNMKYVPKWYPDLLACRGHVCLFWRGYHQRKMLFLVVDSFTDLPNKYFLDLLPPGLLFDYLYPTVYYSLRWYSRNVETILIAFQFQFMRYCWR